MVEGKTFSAFRDETQAEVNVPLWCIAPRLKVALVGGVGGGESRGFNLGNERDTSDEAGESYLGSLLAIIVFGDWLSRTSCLLSTPPT